MAGRWFSLGTPVSSTNKTDHDDITEILLKVALNTIKQPSMVSRVTLVLVELPFLTITLHETGGRKPLLDP
jgi:hypothetical protein